MAYLTAAMPTPLPPRDSIVPPARVARAFGAAVGYERHARVQAEVAATLARQVAAVASRDVRLLEIGCGTGLLTRALIAEGLGGDWLVTDLAPEMVARCRAATAGPGRHYATLNGAWPGAIGPFDLIVSSLAFQWFEDLPGALTRLAACLAPGGALCFATLLDGTFAEWNDAHAEVGVRAGGLAYPDAAQLSAMVPPGGAWTLAEADHTVAYVDARAFLHAVKGIGAGLARADHIPLSPTAMRQVMRAFERRGARATYRVGYGRWVRAG